MLPDFKKNMAVDRLHIKALKWMIIHEMSSFQIDSNGYFVCNQCSKK